MRPFIAREAVLSSRIEGTQATLGELLAADAGAWIDTNKRDKKDGQVDIVGYEINFNRYFYTYTPPRPLEEIEADIEKVEREIMEMLKEMMI